MRNSQPSELSIWFIEGSHGSMFDVVAGENPILVTSLDIHVRIKNRGNGDNGHVMVRVFTKKGSHETYENRQSAWKVCHYSVFQRNPIAHVS